MTHHYGDCEYYRSGVCTCGYLHHLIGNPEIPIDEDTELAIVKHQRICEWMFEIVAKKKDKEAAEREIYSIIEELVKKGR